MSDGRIEIDGQFFSIPADQKSEIRVHRLISDSRSFLADQKEKISQLDIRSEYLATLAVDDDEDDIDADDDDD